MNKILDTTKFVIKNPSYIKINKEKIKDFCENFDHRKNENVRHWLDDAPFKISSLKNEEKLNFLLIFNSISFSYWGEPKWTVEYKGNKYDGAWGMIASLARGIEEKKLALSADFIAKITKKELSYVLRGNTDIPLLKERCSILNKVGKVLKSKYDGSFYNVIRKADRDVADLLNIIVEDFPSFQDFAYYDGRKVYFYKRAQLLIADIYQTFKGKGYGNFKNVSHLTACADYKLPQILRKLGILVYSKELAFKIDNKINLIKGGKEETEIRASTIWAIKFMEEELNKKIPDIYSIHINDHIWLMSQRFSHNDKPYHRVRTIAY